MIELLPVSIGIGLVASLFLSEAVGMAGAGLVVPGYLALHLRDPLSVGLTLACGFAAFGLIRAIGSVVSVYGRRRNILMILAGYLTGMVARGMVGELAGGAAMFPVIGFIIPGLIAVWMDRQGVMQTIASMLTVSIIVRLVLILLGVEVGQ